MALPNLSDAGTEGWKNGGTEGQGGMEGQRDRWTYLQQEKEDRSLDSKSRLD